LKTEGPWLALSIAAIGMIGTLAAGAIGYQSGIKQVDKDYVQIAIDILRKKDSSQELRKWSVDVLNSLSPVPFGKSLEKQLEQQGLSSIVFVRPKLPLDKTEMIKPCPPLPPLKDNTIRTLIRQSVNDDMEYSKCRLRHQALIDFIQYYNKEADKDSDQIKRALDK